MLAAARWPARAVSNGALAVQVFVAGSYSSTVLRTRPRLPAYASMLGTATPYSREEIEGYFHRVGERMWNRDGYKRWLWYERRLKEKGLV